MAEHTSLVRAIQLDTIEAVVAARELTADIASIHVIGQLAGLPANVHTMEDPGGGLNAVLVQAAQDLGEQYGPSGIVALVADLPALRAADLLAVLTRAARVPRGFVPDWSGLGTTTLTARPDVALRPRFGLDSAARHADSGAVALPAADSCRRDVDTQDDLARCLQLGVGRHTAAALCEAAGEL